MTANKTNVKRYDNMGCPEEICRVDTMYESDDGDYVLYEDYEVLQAECEKLKSELDSHKAARIAYASEFPLDGDGNPDVGSIHQNIRTLQAECEKLRKGVADLEAKNNRLTALVDYL